MDMFRPFFFFNTENSRIIFNERCYAISTRRLSGSVMFGSWTTGNKLVSNLYSPLNSRDYKENGYHLSA